MQLPRDLPAIPTEHRLRAFPVGGALVGPSDSNPAYGRATDEFAPAEYGDYAATSLNVYSAVRFRAANIGKLRIRLDRLQPDGDKQEVTSGPAVELLGRVNPFWTFRRLIRMTEWARCLWGSAVWVASRGATGRGLPTELWWVRPDRMRPVVDPTDYLIGWVYEHMGHRIPFTADEVIWLPLDNPIDEFSGLSPLASLRISVDVALDAMRSNRARMRNGMRASALLTPDTAEENWSPDDVEQLATTIRDLYSGVSNAGRTAVWSRLLRVQPLDLTPADLQYLEQLRWSLNDAARAYGIPPELLGDHEHATYSNIDQAEKGVWTDCLQPEADDITDQLTEQYLPMFGLANHELAFDYSMIPALQEDWKAQAETAAFWIDRGVPLNAALQAFAPHLLPANGTGYAWGDVPLWEAKPSPLASNNPVGGGTPPGPDANAADGNPARAALRLLAAERARMIEFGSPEHELRWRAFERRTDRNEASWLTALSEAFGRQQDSVLATLKARRSAQDAENAPFDLAEWNRRFRQMGLPLMQETYQDGAEQTLIDVGAVGISFDLTNPIVTQWLQARAQRFAQQVNETTWQQLKDTLSEGIDAGESIDSLSERVKSVFTTASDSRARLIARTEVVSSSNAGSLEAARQSGVVKGKTWMTALDERVRETHRAAHGQTRGLEEDFHVGSATGPAPGQLGVAAEDINCRCTTLWVLDDGRVAPSVVVRHAH